jgi:hypothetical protein
MQISTPLNMEIAWRVFMSGNLSLRISGATLEQTEKLGLLDKSALHTISCPNSLSRNAEVDESIALLQPITNFLIQFSY